MDMRVSSVDLLTLKRAVRSLGTGMTLTSRNHPRAQERMLLCCLSREERLLDGVVMERVVVLLCTAEEKKGRFGMKTGRVFVSWIVG